MWGCPNLFKLSGLWTHAYPSNETPMIQYLNTHAALEESRKLADADPQKEGPRVRVKC